MRIYLAFLVITLMLIGLVQADLIISPNPIDVIVESGETITIDAEFKNNYDFKIFEFEFSNLSDFTFPEITLMPNESQIIEIQVAGNQVQDSLISSEVSFKYYVDLPEGVKTHYINITEEGPFDPDYIVIRKGDTIQWKNLDTITRSVTSALFDSDLSPNQTFSYTFNEVGEVSYQDVVLFYGGSISVINETEAEKVNNPAYNRIWSVNFEVTLDPTNLSIELDENNFTVEATSSYESFFEITNTGDGIAQKIILSAEPSWINFDENSFDIDPDAKNIVTYKIEPLILSSDDTNQTYTIEIRAKASNTEEIIKTIEVFIPYTEVFEDINTNEGFIAFFARYCESNPNTLICNNTIQSGEGQTVVQDFQIPINITAREFIETLRRIRGIQDQVTRTTNEQKQLNQLIEEQFPGFFELLNQSVMMQEDNENVATARTRGFWIVVLFAILIGCIIIGGYSIRKYLKKRSTIEQGYRTSWT